ncbi:protein FAR1-RELATED SEQUENCE 5-like isoform X2 [Impatiens glandulifera]|nr:protein FAR1-RELATED SEQUENCE 5-like isoform X2 [Impatiens glandulifera]XP_047338732.1 protein FAR1-RELATED SEQUENCE 5-like isoform X2 [Impatiens glandulifera]
MDNETGRTEEADSSETNCIEEAQVGMVFESEEVARAFYNVYAMRMGFTTRVLSSRKSERDGSLISRGLGCRMSPPRPPSPSDNQNSDKVAAKHQRDHKRDLCTAMILIKREKPGRWVVARFVKEHNHSLVASLPSGCPPPDWKDRKIQELTTELRAKKKLSAAYRDQLLSLVNDVENQNGHLSKRIHLVLKNLTELEAKRKSLPKEI